MIDNTARESIPGRDANMPSYIVERMVALKLRPTLTQLALGTGTPLNTLRQNLNGTKAMKLVTAIGIAKFLKCSVDDLVASGLQ